MNATLRVLFITALVGLALAAGASYSIIVNGQVAEDKAIVVNGKTYIPLAVLSALGVKSSLKGNTLTLGGSASSASANQTPSATPIPGGANQVAPGGANQVAALEGCVGETLFNGIWRVKVISLEPTSEPLGVPGTPGWAVKLEVRNGTKQNLAMMSTGIGAGSGGSQPTLVMPDGNTLQLNDNDFLKPWSASLLQGGSTTFTLRFAFPQGTTDAQVQRPAKFIMEINPKIPDYVGVKYAVPDPSLRVRLDCQK